ncbi:MAG: helix-turn-helix domain-containing protein [Luteolibacter sp.]
MSDLPYHHDWQPRFETTLGLRVKWFGRWGGDPEWAIEPSRLAADLICFFYLEHGLCRLLVNGVEVPLRPGELVVLRGGDVFSGSQDPEHPQTSLSACLSLNRDNTANVLLRHAYRRRYRLPDPEAYVGRFAAVLNALDTDSRWRNFHVTGAIFDWLAALLEAIRPEPGAAEGSPETVHHVLAAQEWIQRRLDGPVTVAAWARACRLNPDYFSRLFKAHTGMSPKMWLVEARLQRAARLLVDRAATVEIVAERCGFNCPFHFSRTFKGRFGVPPASYRRIRQVRGFFEPA